MELPSGFTWRPATDDDAVAVYELARAASIVDVGEPMVELDDIRTDFANPAMDLAQDTVLVHDGPKLIASAQVLEGRADVDVHPMWRRRGLGLALVEWTEQRALEQAGPDTSARVGQTVTDSLDGAHELFEQRGYERLWDSWVLRLPPDAPIESCAPPADVTIRPFRPDEETRVYEIIDNAFSEWEHRDPRTFEQWRQVTTARAIFDPSMLLVAAVDDVVVGACVGLPFEDEGWVDQIAVVPEERGRGIARAMLRAIFNEFRARGERRIGLNTDSRTGALGLYLDAGMVVEYTFTRWSKLFGRNI